MVLTMFIVNSESRHVSNGPFGHQVMEGRRIVRVRAVEDGMSVMGLLATKSWRANGSSGSELSKTSTLMLAAPLLK